MNKRQRKKLSKSKCPKCFCTTTIGELCQLRTGRWISRFLFCPACEDPEYYQKLRDFDVKEWLSKFKKQ